MLVRSQDGLSGFWKGSGLAEANPVVGTSFGLLFLAKGRRPVLVAKLKHDPPGDWNNHRNDLANLTSFVERLWQRDLTWQVVNAAAASVEDLLQAPVLVCQPRISFLVLNDEAPSSERCAFPRSRLLQRRRLLGRFAQPSLF